MKKDTRDFFDLRLKIGTRHSEIGHHARNISRMRIICQIFSHITARIAVHTNVGIPKADSRRKRIPRITVIPAVVFRDHILLWGENNHVQVQQGTRSRSKGSSEPVQDGSSKRGGCTSPILNKQKTNEKTYHHYKKGISLRGILW